MDADSVSGRSRLWELRFNDMNNIALGGVARVLITGTESHPARMMDNVALDADERLLHICEDTGRARNNRLLTYDRQTGRRRFIAEHVDGSGHGEFSGVVDVSAVFGEGFFLLTAMETDHNVDNAATAVVNSQLIAYFHPTVTSTSASYFQ